MFSHLRINELNPVKIVKSAGQEQVPNHAMADCAELNYVIYFILYSFRFQIYGKGLIMIFITY